MTQRIAPIRTRESLTPLESSWLNQTKYVTAPALPNHYLRAAESSTVPHLIPFDKSYSRSLYDRHNSELEERSRSTSPPETFRHEKIKDYSNPISIPYHYNDYNINNRRLTEHGMIPHPHTGITPPCPCRACFITSFEFYRHK